MKHLRIIAALAILCLLAGSAFAVSKLMTAVVDKEECIGCGACLEKFQAADEGACMRILTCQGLVDGPPDTLKDLSEIRRGRDIQ